MPFLTKKQLAFLNRTRNEDGTLLAEGDNGPPTKKRNTVTCPACRPCPRAYVFLSPDCSNIPCLGHGGQPRQGERRSPYVCDPQCSVRPEGTRRRGHPSRHNSCSEQDARNGTKSEGSPGSPDSEASSGTQEDACTCGYNDALCCLTYVEYVLRTRRATVCVTSSLIAPVP